MKKHMLMVTILSILPTILLSACWDQRLLRDHTLILAIGYDKEDSGELLKTVSFPNPSSQTGAENNQGTESGSKVVSTIGNTVKDAEKKLDKTIPEQFDRSKARIIFLGETLAKEGIFSTLDSLYRDLRGPLNANAAIFAGKAQNALSANVEDSLIVSDVYAELLKSAEQSGIIKNYSIQTARPKILAQGSDLVLPLLSIDEKDEPQIEGMALFHGDKMTGTLDVKETIVYLMLSDHITNKLAINLQVSDDKEELNKNFVNISVLSIKQKLNVQIKDEQIEANVYVDLNVEIDEYADNHLGSKKKTKALESKIQKELEEQSKDIIQKLLQANNDSLGIGERVRAFHNDEWQKLDWKDAYKNTQIQASFNVDIVHHGIIR